VWKPLESPACLTPAGRGNEMPAGMPFAIMIKARCTPLFHCVSVNSPVLVNS
jgi:hypothetical protein